ncbi:hypothetical protein F9L33_15475 [Amylibacter sp. SFDW26]|uniref:HNH endonuclease n=1 Tax=Amylibacter sp. SFDW26 TaxID=2652722 RepID=UPI001261AEC5|nr:HNH endonuclease [Amylibacter sp. SFDW26]KAB7609820.1 hypothetical protein F9L33_15475 [Amylibacter sp. SFDW26]
MGTNRYAYPFNDPVNKLDPNGNFAFLTAIIGALAAHGSVFAGLAIFTANVGFFLAVHSFGQTIVGVASGKLSIKDAIVGLAKSYAIGAVTGFAANQIVSAVEQTISNAISKAITSGKGIKPAKFSTSPFEIRTAIAQFSNAGNANIYATRVSGKNGDSFIEGEEFEVACRGGGCNLGGARSGRSNNVGGGHPSQRMNPDARLGGPKAGSSSGKGAGKRFSTKIKDQARAESGNRCVFCKTKTTNQAGPNRSEIDHSIPKSRGGNNSLDNAQNTCRTCNRAKSNKTTGEFLRLRRY